MPVMSRPQKKLTAAEFLHWPDDGQRHELIDGVHYMTPSPNLNHQVIVGRLHLAIANFLVQHRQIGWVFLARLDVVLSDYDVVEPDLLFVARDQRALLTEANVQGPPALVVEILSPSTRRRDEGIKRRLYDQRGVREYWLIDPKGMRVEVCRRADDGTLSISSILDATSGDQLSTPLLPGFALNLDELFEELL